MRLKKRLRSSFSSFLKDESGQSTVEYILILAVVVMVAMKFKTTFQSKMTGITNDLGNKIEQAVSSE